MVAREILTAALAGGGLLLLFSSFIGVQINDPPPQHTSPVTGFPTWHQTYENEVKEITIAFTVLALLFSTGAAYAAMRAVRPPSRSLTGFVTLSSGAETGSTQINQFILLYINATWVAVVAYLFFDVGKLWAVMGALHNLLEVALLIVLQSGGRVTSMSFGLYMFAYVCITILLSVYLSWPMDAIFFRWQGLCSDFGLIVMFVRMYLSTKKQLDAFGGKDKHDRQLAKAQRAADHHQTSAMISTTSLQTVNLTSAAAPEASSHGGHPNPFQQIQTGWRKLVANAPVLGGGDSSDSDSDDENHSRTRSSRRQQNATLTPETIHSHTNGSHGGHAQSPPPHSTIIQVPYPSVPASILNPDPTAIWGMQWTNPDQILLLVAASIFHVLGNCVTTIWITSTLAMAAFHISYGLSFPLYAYYLYVDNHALRQTKIYMPEFSKVKNFTFACLALAGSTATIRAGLYVSTQAKAGGAADYF